MKIKKINALLLLSIIICLSNANGKIDDTDDAGVGSVGNGGGLAEMKAYDLNLQLPQLTHLCTSYSYCEKNGIFLSLENTPTTTPILNKECLAPFFHRNNGTVTLDSCQLYAANGLPLSTFEILKSIATLKILAIHPNISIEQASATAEILKIFLEKIIVVQSNTTILWENSKFKSLHFEKFFIKGQLLNQNVYLETQYKSFQIFPSLKNSLTCSEPLPESESIDFNEVEINQQTSTFLGLSMSVEYLCGSKKISGKVYINAQLSQNETLETHINTLIF